MKIRNLQKHYILDEVDPLNPHQKKVIKAVDGLDLTLELGEIFVLMGQNGAGKTTLIQMITGTIEATNGAVSCFGKHIINKDDQCIVPQISNKQIQENTEYIRQITGICPQQNILFDQLTVREHLDVFCNFKMQQHILDDQKLTQQKKDKILMDIDLWNFQDTLAQDLSGGNKRKLSVALALVSDSKLVLLDEPTSGMDLTARRKLWEMLNQYKKDRIIILSTHNMDEAELLADKIGIMKQGKLVCFDSPSNLKNDLSYGFKLKIIFDQNSSLNNQVLRKKILSYLRNYLGDQIHEVKQPINLKNESRQRQYSIPKSYSEKFEMFFKEFEKTNSMNEFCYQSYELEPASLEDVYLELTDENYEIDTYEQQEDIEIFEKNIEETQIESVPQVQSSFIMILLIQTLATLKRQLQFYKRNLFQSLSEHIIPAALIAVGFAFLKIQFGVETHPKTLKPDLYPQQQRLMVGKNIVIGEEDEDDQLQIEDILKNLPGWNENKWFLEWLDVEESILKEDTESNYEPIRAPNFAFIQEQMKKIEQAQDLEQQKIEMAKLISGGQRRRRLQYKNDNEDLHQKYQLFQQENYESRGWDKEIYQQILKKQNKSDPQNQNFEKIYPNRYGSYYIFEANNKTKQFKVSNFLNLTSQDAVALFPQFMYEALLKTASGYQDLNFSFTIDQFPPTPTQREQEEDASGVFVCFVAGIGFALIPASIASVIVSERELGTKHNQVIKGINLSAYWIAFAITDILRTYLPCFLTIYLIQIFDLDLQEVWRVLILLPWSLIPFTYATSYIFQNESTAQTFTIYLHFLLSGIAGMIVFALRMVQDTALWGDRIMKIMRYICPTFNLCDAIIFAASKNLMYRQRNENRRDIQSNFERRSVPYDQYEKYLPSQIQPYDSFSQDNIGGNLTALVHLAIFWTFVFLVIESLPNQFWDRIFSFLQIKNTSKVELNQQDDEDVIEEEQKVQKMIIGDKKQISPICVDKLQKYYTIPFSKPKLAVKKASFSVQQGECFALLGVNGAGKSTTFKTLTNVVNPSSGQVLLKGQSITQNFNQLRHLIGYCPQHHALFTGVTVREHLEFYVDIKMIYDGKMKEKIIKNVIKRLGITAHQHKLSEHLSGGNKRKLQVAIALLCNPKIILLDEPSAGMDPVARRFMWAIIQSLTCQNPDQSVVLTTHSMQEAEALSHRIGILGIGGQFKCFGTPLHIKKKFGQGFEIQIKTFQINEQHISEMIKNFGLQTYQDMLMTLDDYMKILKNNLKTDNEFLQKITINFQDLESFIQQPKISPQNFISCLQTQLTISSIIEKMKESLKQPNIEVQIIETYADKYIKLQVKLPQNKNGEIISTGMLIGMMEKIKNQIGRIYIIQDHKFAMDAKQGQAIEEYQVSHVSLDAIFQKLAVDIL